MANEGLIEVKDAYILEADHNLRQLTTKRLFGGIGRCVIPIRFVMNTLCKFVTINDPTNIELENIQLTVSAMHG